MYLKTQRVVSGHQFGAHSRPKIGPMSSSSGQRIGNRMPANFSSQPQSAVNIKRIDEQSAQEIPHVELPESVEHNGIPEKVRAVTTVNAQSTNMISSNR